MRVEVGGKAFTDWTSARLQRSLSELSGSFEFEYDDQLRMFLELPRAEARMEYTFLIPPSKVRILLDGELVMVGWLEDLEWSLSGDQVTARLSGRDVVGVAVDCSVNPNGPYEYNGLTVLEIVTRLCAPFGIPVRAEADVGAPLPEYGLEVGETLRSAIDKAVKQRALLALSDGIGGLLLTRGGTGRAPAALRVGGNVVSVSSHVSLRERYSDYYVKGQARPQRGHRKARFSRDKMPLTARPDDGDETAEQSRRAVASPGPVDGAASPIELPAIEVTAAQSQQAATISTGYAHDAEMTIYRPRVFTLRTQSGSSSTQTLADWRMRLGRAQGARNTYKVAGWRDGPNDRLWRPNELVGVIYDSIKQTKEYLIAGLHYVQSDQGGSTTELELVGKGAYELEPLPDQHKRHGVAKGSNVGNIGIDRASPGRSSR